MSRLVLFFAILSGLVFYAGCGGNKDKKDLSEDEKLQADLMNIEEEINYLKNEQMTLANLAEELKVASNKVQSNADNMKIIVNGLESSLNNIKVNPKVTEKKHLISAGDIFLFLLVIVVVVLVYLYISEKKKGKEGAAQSWDTTYDVYKQSKPAKDKEAVDSEI